MPLEGKTPSVLNVLDMVEKEHIKYWLSVYYNHNQGIGFRA